MMISPAEFQDDLDELRAVAARVSICCRPLSNVRLRGEEDFRPRERFPAASVIKAAIMATLLEGCASGKLSLQETVTVRREDMVGGAGVLFELEERAYTLAELCTLMMVVSDNTASNACLRAVGFESFREFCQRRGYDAEIHRFFMSPVVDGRDNFLTAEAAAFVLADLYCGEGLTPELREFAVGCLRRQQFREKIPLMLPEDTVVGHKTGELPGVRHDAAVVETDDPYVLVILTADGGAPWEVDLAIAKHSLRMYQKRVSVER